MTLNRIHIIAGMLPEVIKEKNVKNLTKYMAKGRNI